MSGQEVGSIRNTPFNQRALRKVMSKRMWIRLLGGKRRSLALLTGCSVAPEPSRLDLSTTNHPMALTACFGPPHCGCRRSFSCPMEWPSMECSRAGELPTIPWGPSHGGSLSNAVALSKRKSAVGVPAWNAYGLKNQPSQ
ncbi:hypothetical protein COLO4_01168 [Corchorus olitorius]|uniref:Uncharacterized protein n=1 Tax=Corchorus olitorius TaxID=93759 RepID=A0A1R3L2V6_9ROSI|nr:hypothetical protein COLO4_01168 [Corchorus olitorius]